MSYNKLLSLMTITSLWSCGPLDQEIENVDLVWKPAALTEGGTWSGVTFTAEEATAVLDMANTATLSQLDHEMGLVSTAAKNMVSRRPLRTMLALDDVPYVGKAALKRLRGYVPSWSVTPGGTAVTQSGVTFTTSETETVLEMINGADAALLDSTIGLDTRAVQGILAARPLGSLAALDALPYVGGNALNKLKDYIPLWTAPTSQEGGTHDGVAFTAKEQRTALEIANIATADQLTSGGLSGAPRNIIIANRPWAGLGALADYSGIGTGTLQALKGMVPGWTAAPPPAALTVTALMQEAKFHGTASIHYNQVVRVKRAIVTSEPLVGGGSQLSFWIADPDGGDLQGLKVSVSFPEGQSTAFITIFDELRLTGRFSRLGNTFQLRLDDAERHQVELNRSGLAHDEYKAIQAAWHSTAKNPEGAVRVVSKAGYVYMVPLPLFLDHPMWQGDPPSPPADSGNEQDLAWNALAQQTLNDWRAAL